MRTFKTFKSSIVMAFYYLVFSCFMKQIIVWELNSNSRSSLKIKFMERCLCIFFAWVCDFTVKCQFQTWVYGSSDSSDFLFIYEKVPRASLFRKAHLGISGDLFLSFLCHHSPDDTRVKWPYGNTPCVCMCACTFWVVFTLSAVGLPRLRGANFTPFYLHWSRERSSL